METNLNNFGRIGVLMGGPSSEREISLKSGQAVFESLKIRDLDAVAVDIQTDNWQENLRLIQDINIDIAFIALHGRFGEDGQIQTLLEQLNIPYTGSDSVASGLAMDKVASRAIFVKEGLPAPNYVVLSEGSDRNLYSIITADLNPPFVVKPAAEGSSIGLSIVSSRTELEKAVDIAFSFQQSIIVEEYIPGREITVGILDDSVLPVVEIIPQNRFYDYEAKYTPGMSDYVVPANLDPGITHRCQSIAQSAHRLLGCFGFSRVDLRLRHDNIPFVLEVNSIPGLTKTSLLPKAAKAAGIDFTQLCVRILDSAYKRSLIRIK